MPSRIKYDVLELQLDCTPGCSINDMKLKAAQAALDHMVPVFFYHNEARYLVEYTDIMDSVRKGSR